MTGKQFLRISAISLGLLDAGSGLAQEGQGQAWQEKQPAQQQAGEADQAAFRNRVQTRMRSMNQEERLLMNDLSVNGRQRMETENAAQVRGTARDGSTEGSRFGRGYEARQVQQNPETSGGSAMSGAGQGMGARGGGGRGR
ncbi:MAG: hypothetical protein K8H84_06765 [Sulfuricella denitrificans]|nr:hypothetical protein [Sulfuricella denitrificans]